MSNNVSVTISRNSRDTVRIRMKCRTSGIQFVEAELTLENYALLTTGLSEVEATAVFNKLEHIGKRKVSERRQAIMPGNFYDKNQMRKWLIENCEEEGWTIDAYLGSQGSVGRKGDDTVLNYHVFKYVSATE